MSFQWLHAPAKIQQVLWLLRAQFEGGDTGIGGGFLLKLKILGTGTLRRLSGKLLFSEQVGPSSFQCFHPLAMLCGCGACAAVRLAGFLAVSFEAAFVVVALVPFLAFAPSFIADALVGMTPC